MKIRGRLIVAFLIIITIPVILMTTVVGVILNYQTNSINESYEIESNPWQIMNNPLKLLNRLTRGIYNELKSYSIREPDKLKESEFLEEINEELKQKYSFLIVREEDNFIYIGDEKRLGQIKDLLPKFGIYVTESEGGLYVGDKYPYLLKKQDFYFEGNKEASFYIATDLSTILPQIKNTTIQMIISIVVILCVTAAILTYWIYQGILRPLNALRMATYKIKNGDWDFSIVSESNDEIGILCQDFEAMRVQLKELIEVQMQYEQDTRELISNMSHDLKTPITAIKGYTEGIMDGVADTPEKMEKYLKIIYQKANDMTMLVDELSFYAKIDCNTIPYSFQDINLDAYFTDCINDWILDLEVKNIELEYENEADPDLEIVADAEQLKRVVNNIIGNSVKYMDKENGLIFVSIKEKEEFVKVELGDNGKGVGKGDLKNIFERFYRTDASRNSSKGGSGLGLAIAKKIIEDHGGSIWADSVEGEGTSIFFTLKKSEKCLTKLEQEERAINKKLLNTSIKE